MRRNLSGRKEKCPVHCYKPEKREKVREVMRFAGPRMIYTHPYLAVMHVVDKNRKTGLDGIIEKWNVDL